MNNNEIEIVDSLVSIIMPVHNCEEYLVESVKSICNQTYKNLEIIIVDTSSNDNIYELINQINDDRIRILRLKSDKGLTYSFEEGLKHAKGEFITRQDPDDISVPNRIEKQVNYLKLHENLGMVSCLIKCTTDDASYRRECIFIEKVQNHYTTKDSIEKAIIGGFIPIIFPTLLIRKELFDKANVPDELNKFDDQIELLLELIKIGGVGKIDMSLYSYRRHKKAYHVVNSREYEKYVENAIEESDIKNFLTFREFYENIKFEKNELKLNEKSPVRVLMLIDALNIGGTETHVLNLVRELINMGIYVVVGTNGGPLTGLFKRYGIKVVKIPMKTDYLSNKEIFTVLKRVKYIIDEENINLIHCHLFASMRIGSEMNRRYKIPYITTIHGLFYPKDILARTCFNAESIITVSEPVKRLICTNLGNRIKHKVKVIPNAVYIKDNKIRGEEIKIRTELNIPKNDLVIVYCSRLAWNKTTAAECAIFSFYELSRNYDNIHIIVIGDGEGKYIVQRESEMLNNALGRNVIHIVGAKTSVEQYYLESDIVVGTGRVALEAMSYGKPVIAVGNQGYVGIITPEDKQIQWEMYFGDHDALEKPNISNLTESMKFLLDNPQKRIELGLRGREWCEEMFNIDKISKEIINIYKSVLKI